MAVLEAMAVGVPALVSDRVGFGQAIREHDTAGLVELTPQGVRADLGKILTQYDINIVAKRLLDEYAKVVKGREKA